MANSNHTPGPWFAVQYADWWQLQNVPYYADGNILKEGGIFDFHAAHNAQLAATAPELLKALQDQYKFTQVIAAFLPPAKFSALRTEWNKQMEYTEQVITKATTLP